MTLPMGFGRIDWSDWIRGVMASFIAGGANGVVAGLAASLNDPKDYALGSAKFMNLFGTVFVTSGMINLASFLRTKPIPDLKQVTTTTQTTQQSDGAKVVKTVQETSVERK